MITTSYLAIIICSLKETKVPKDHGLLSKANVHRDQIGINTLHSQGMSYTGATDIVTKQMF